MQQRIDRLETLVRSLASQRKDEGPLMDAGNKREGGIKSIKAALGNGHQFNDVRHGLGVMQITEQSSTYKGSTHWEDVFQELDELKTIWKGAQRDDEDTGLHTSNVTTDGPALLCGLLKPVGLDDLLATLPAKPAVDKLIQRFFEENNSPVPSFHILHPHTFMQQYENHWHNPYESKLMWLGLLFSMLSLVMLSYHADDNEPPEYEGVSESLFELYRMRTAQCLMLADITKCAPHTLETLLFNAFAEQASRNANGASVWLMFGVITRVALQMGYHRDPSNYHEISVFEGEIRRRLWYSVRGMDALMSFQSGLPSMVRSLRYDTLDPSNLYSTELYEGMTKLPPSRPKSDVTPISYLLAKGRLAHILGEIGDFLSSLDSLSYDTVMKLDGDLSSARAELPAHFQVQSGKSQTPTLFSQTVQLEILYHQAMCILHRKFLAKGRVDQIFERSRTRCLESAMGVLSLQVILYEDAKRPGGKTSFAHNWCRLSFTSQDFILAAIVLCLDLRHIQIEDAEKATSRLAAATEQQESILTALNRACHIWKEAKDSSPETSKMYGVFSHMLNTLGISDKSTNSRLPEWQNAAPVELFPNDNQHSMETLNDVEFEDFDWTLWNSFIEGGSFEDAYGSMASPQLW
ncbi:Equisetin cluster transcription factor eqxF [Lachnellula suecica]|uniref:Equisetin cluster transcription factor eqxF n=1 Tax=Lachnellula suecica TaxID=602035 RepID=A0A8T9CHB6_9HELO|nr:Equisetin cluster transcription factor eqxF [Lachnellula suecica]